ncbi:YSIRK-type signal peptide-containing protein [Streptococcus sp. 21WXBC0044M1]|uniref:YSIRK-type signal peptide-containing protein n=1 Tax=Streptococcus jiangnanensis TaxID=3095079 RepID=A0ABU5FZK7_9STRE|nr:YSIRK-type signal peptide-containing protein [Streptococcus sp. 21WXBC0044M1]MDY4364600.1 YSIRK-type signal peptide-containing protein [Streptococcus sp. 21WXBC0044M1]
MMKKKFFNQSFSRFSIRKLSVGTCSVLLGTFMVMATSPVQADEAQVNNKEQQTQAEIQQKEKSAENGQEVISEPQKEVTQNEAVKDQKDKTEPSKTEVSAPVAQSQPVSQIDNTKEASQPSLEEEKKQSLESTPTEQKSKEESSSSGKTSSRRKRSLDEVNAAFKAHSPIKDIHAVDSVRESLTFSITGHEADYSGGYIKIHFQNGKAIKLTPSPVGGVKFSQEKINGDLDLKIEPANLRGGANYNFVYTFQIDPLTQNWGGAVQAIGPDHKVTATAKLYDKNGNVLKELGSIEHTWKVLENGVGGLTPMSNNQVIGYDRNNDGIVDEDSSVVSYYLFNGAKDPKNNTARNDYFNYGNGVFDGRMINGMGISDVGGHIIDPITSYTYNIELKEGYELTDEAKALGWTADATGYHLTINRANNPLQDVNNNKNKLIPISFKLKNAKVADINRKAQNLTVTGIYTKADGTSYQNTVVLPYTLLVQKTDQSESSLFEFRHYNQSDSEIIRSYGETEYRSNVRLSSVAEVEKDYPINDYTVTHKIQDSRESYREVNVIEERQWNEIFSSPDASVEVYNKATGELLGTFNSNTRSLRLTEEQDVKELEYKFKNIKMRKSSTNDTSAFFFQTKTRFNNWESLYKDSTISKLDSRTDFTFKNTGNTVSFSQTASAELTRVVQQISMIGRARTDVFNRHTDASGFKQDFITRTAGKDTPTQNFANLTGVYYLAYLADPQLNFSGNPNFKVYYNYKDTGKTLYYAQVKGTPDSPMPPTLLKLENKTIPNGTYTYKAIAFWDEELPDVQAQNGYDLGELDGITVTSKNSVSYDFDVIVQASEASGVYSEVKRATNQHFAYNTQEHYPGDEIDFRVTYKNASKQPVSDVYVLSSLPMKADKQLESRNRGSGFTVSLTKALTPPSGWEVQYSRTAGTATEINASQWLTADQVSDWSEIRAVRWHSTAPVAAGSRIQFPIDGAVIGQDTAPGATAYLSSALANDSSKYTESNNVSIQMSTKLSSASFTFVDINDPSKEVQLGQVDTVVGKPNGPISYDPARRIKELEDAGYELISNDFTDHTFGDSASPKQFKFQFRHKITELTETVRGTREVDFEYLKKTNHSDLSLLPPKHVETHSFTRTKRIDQVLAKRQPNDATAGVTYSAWSADQTWSQVISPEIPGYYPREDIDANTMSGEGALYEYLMNADDPRDEELEKEFTWYRVVYYVPLPVVPSASAAKSKGIQGQKQAATIHFDDDRASESEVHFTKGTTTINGAKKSVELVRSSVFLYDENGQKVTSLTIANQGTYDLDLVNKTIVFTPLKTFYGPATPVQVGVVDKNGESAVTTYTPVVERVTPTGSGDKTEGLQGQVQEGKVTFTPGHDSVPFPADSTPLFDNGTTVKEVPNVGKFEVDADGKVTFTPDKQFKGETPELELTRVDANGTPVTVKYQAVVKEVVPTSTNATSTGPQGVPQTGAPTFQGGDPLVPIDETVEPTFADGSKEKTIPGQGTYTIAPDGTVTFTPDKQFVGNPDPVTVKRVDKNGTPVTATYSPEFTKVTPTGTGATSTGPQGLPQTGTPTFQGGDPLVPIDEAVEPTFEDGSKEKNIPGQGTYTIAPDGTVTFTPDKQFVGNPDPVTVKRVDKNGTPVTATYSPEFTKVTPTGSGDKTEGLQGQVQEGKVTFTPGHASVPFPADSTPLFDNGTTVKEVPDVGKFEVDADGKVTFTPDKQFKGETPELELTRVDANGTPVTVKYQAVVKEVVPTSTNATSTGPQGVPQTGTPTFQGGDPLVPIDETVEPTFADGSKEKSIPGQGTYTIAPDGTVTFTPDKQFVGKPDPVTVKRVDKNGTPVTATYTPTVTKVTPIGTNANSTGPQGLPQTGTPSFQGGDSLIPIDETVEPIFADGSKEKVISGQGTYTISPDGTVTFTPDKQFVGNPTPVTVKRVDKNGTPVTATYSPEFTKVTPTGSGDKTEGLQGQVQEGKVTFTSGHDSVPFPADSTPLFDNGTTVKEVLNVGKFEVDADGKVTFTPDKQFKGETPELELTRVDVNGTPVTVKYHAVVKEVVPTSTNATSTGPQGVPQTGTPTFQGGDPLVPIDETVEPIFDDGSKEKSIPGQGTYTIASNGTVTFTPDKQFVGNPDPVTVKRVDKNGTSVTATYSPEFTKVTPTGTGDKTEGLQGQVQEGKVTFTPGHDSVQFPTDSTPLFDNGTTVKEVPNVGKFEVDADGKVTFTPDKQFKGETPELELTRVDVNGTPVTVKYHAVVKEVVPTSTNATSTGPQGVPQTGTPSFQGGDPLVPIDETVEPTFEDGSKEKTIPGQGTYTIAPDGTVTFTPDKQFVGNPTPVTVKRVDKNGTPVTATYSPEFTKVTPTGKDTSSVNIKGLVQTGTPTFEGGNPLVPIDETVAATFEDGTTEKVIPGEGTYAISLDGIVTFTPEANFVGKGTGVTIVRKDKNGTPVTASYRPTVVDPSTGHDTTSTGAKGQPQVATPTFERHIDSTVPPTFEDGSTTMIVPGEGSYTIDKDGQITFTPEPDFVGTAKGLVVKRLDMYGNVVTARYTPTVLGQTQVSDATSEGLKGQTQTGKPNFTGDVDLTVPPTFEDGTTEKVVPGEGTYVISPDGTVTFTPEADFVGQAKGVKVIRKDRNGNIISGFYTPTVVELPEQVKPSDKKELSVPDSKPDQLTQNISVEKNQLPNTGSQEDGLKNLGILTALAGAMTLGLLGKKKRNDESD